MRKIFFGHFLEQGYTLTPHTCHPLPHAWNFFLQTLKDLQYSTITIEGNSMIGWIMHIILDAVVLLVAAKFMNSVEVRSFGTAIFIALLIGIFSFLVTLILNIFTLGLFALVGLGFLIRILANAIIIEVGDQISSGFNTRGFLPSLWLAIIIALVGSLFDAIIM